MTVCNLCDKPFSPSKTGPRTFCSQKCSRENKKILDAYATGRIPKMNFPRGMVIKVMKNYNLPIHGVSFDERGRSSRFGGNVFDAWFY